MDVFALGKAHGFTLPARMRIIINGSASSFTFDHLKCLVADSNRAVQAIQNQIEFKEQKIKTHANKKLPKINYKECQIKSRLLNTVINSTWPL